MESIQKNLNRIKALKKELEANNKTVFVSDIFDQVNRLKEISLRYSQIVETCREEFMTDDFQKYHKLQTNIDVTISQLELQSEALLNKCISLIE